MSMSLFKICFQFQILKKCLLISPFFGAEWLILSRYIQHLENQAMGMLHLRLRTGLMHIMHGIVIKMDMLLKQTLYGSTICTGTQHKYLQLHQYEYKFLYRVYGCAF